MTKKKKPVSKSRIGKCDKMEHTDKDVICSHGNCQQLKKIISSGMYIVEFEKKYFHASCAKKLGIEFIVPIPKKRKKEE